MYHYFVTSGANKIVKYNIIKYKYKQIKYYEKFVIEMTTVLQKTKTILQYTLYLFI